jgi:cytochrome c peroxidase
MTISVTGPVPASHPFFASLGTNGRACATCHRPDSGWSITPASVQAAFDRTGGMDPLFRKVDGSNSPLANVSSVTARRNAYSMLLNRGVIRVGLPIPAGAEFTLAGVDDPYRFASAAQLSLFRRPLPATNLAFLSSVMWDGRQTALGQSINSDLARQAMDAIQTHEEGSIAGSSPLLTQIVTFESGLYSAQVFDNHAGPLTVAGAAGGPQPLTSQAFFIGINDPTKPSFNRNVFTTYSAWNGASATPSQQSIARGQSIFNTRPFTVSNVGGFNDVLRQPMMTATCSTCHNTPNVGSNSTRMLMNLGLTDLVRRTSDMPLYTLQNKANRQIRQTTDPGLALITGRWADIGRFKVPSLRGLASRAPYFHDGSARQASDVVDFYDRRFGIHFNPRERADLSAFLNSL